MKTTIKTFLTAILSILIFTSCNNSDSNSSDKELELQKKALELKERELALKEKEFAQQDNKTNTDSTTAKTTTPSTTPQKTASENTTNSTASDYNFAGHSNFQTFWADFKKAALAKDKEAVALMTHFPFEDHETLENLKSGELNCNNSPSFLAKYDRIMNSKCLDAIKKNDYRGWHPPDEFDFEDVIQKGEYILNVNYSEVRLQNMVFSKQSGKYKLTRIQYYS